MIGVDPGQLAQAMDRDQPFRKRRLAAARGVDKVRTAGHDPQSLIRPEHGPGLLEIRGLEVGPVDHFAAVSLTAAQTLGAVIGRRRTRAPVAAAIALATAPAAAMIGGSPTPLPPLGAQPPEVSMNSARIARASAGGCRLSSLRCRLTRRTFSQ